MGNWEVRIHLKHPIVDLHDEVYSIRGEISSSGRMMNLGQKKYGWIELFVDDESAIIIPADNVSAIDVLTMPK